MAENFKSIYGSYVCDSDIDGKVVNFDVQVDIVQSEWSGDDNQCRMKLQARFKPDKSTRHPTATAPLVLALLTGAGGKYYYLWLPYITVEGNQWYDLAISEYPNSRPTGAGVDYIIRNVMDMTFTVTINGNWAQSYKFVSGTKSTTFYKSNLKKRYQLIINTTAGIKSAKAIVTDSTVRYDNEEQKQNLKNGSFVWEGSTVRGIATVDKNYEFVGQSDYSIVISENNRTFTFRAQLIACLNIFFRGVWGKFSCYRFEKGVWKQHLPYVRDGNEWKRCQ